MRIPFGACLKASEVRSVCAREGIAFQAYASLGAGALGLPEHPTVTKIAKELGATTGQVLLRWSLQVCFLSHVEFQILARDIAQDTTQEIFVIKGY